MAQAVERNIDHLLYDIALYWSNNYGIIKQKGPDKWNHYEYLLNPTNENEFFNHIHIGAYSTNRKPGKWAKPWAVVKEGEKHYDVDGFSNIEEYINTKNGGELCAKRLYTGVYEAKYGKKGGKYSRKTRKHIHKHKSRKHKSRKHMYKRQL